MRTRLIFVMILMVGLVSACSKKAAKVEPEASVSESLLISKVALSSSGEQGLLNIQANHEPKYNVFKLSEPDRVVVDLIDAELAADVPTQLAGEGGVSEVKIEAMKDSLSSLVRVEIYLKSGMSYLATTDGNQLNVSLLGGISAPVEPSASPAEPMAEAPLPAPAPSVEETPAPLPTPEPEVALAPVPTPSAELPSLPAPQPEPAPVAEAPTQELPAVEPKVEEPPVAMPEVAPLPMPMPETKTEEEVAASEAPKVEAAPLAESKEEVAPTESKLKDLPKPRKIGNGKMKPAVETQEIPISGLTEGTSLLTELDTKVYTGRRVSLEFQNADVQDILRLIAEVSKLNIITNDLVKGSLTLKLIDVPWDQALDIILTTLSLDKVQHGNIIRIAPAETLKKERETALANDKAAKQLEPLRLKLININYATGEELSARIKNLLSERGTVDVDARTNTLIIKDIKENLTRIENLIKVLDTQTPQVRVESRIVQANDSFARNFGIQWGPTLNLNDTNSRAREYQFPHEITGAGIPSSDSGTKLSGWAVDAASSSKGSQLGFRLGSVSDIFDLDLRLSYAEIESVGRVISRPSITVLDNRTARIIQGTKIPFLSSSSSGANVSFQEAGIEISVTPHITNDGSVLMKINTKSNEPQSGDVGGNRIISIREATTELLVKSARTAVLGGVFKTVETNSETGVPGLKDVPVLGWLFKGRDRAKNREELLIFITPYILSDSRSAATNPASDTNFEE